jgi:hypothetical protein
MSNTYGSYLEEEQKKQAPGAPVAQPVAPQAQPTSVQTADGYSKFLETLANNKKIENTPTNAKTYADYLAYTGRDPVGDYQAKVRQANLDYAKAMSTYGQNAEKLAKSGLSGSGYGEYLTGLAYAGKQSAVAGAQKDAKAALDQSFSSYGDYIEGLKNTNEQAAMTGILNQMLEGDAAKDYARSLGVTEDRLEYVLSQTSASVSAAKAQKAQEAQALLANATAAVTELTANDQTLDAAIESLRGVYDKDTLDKVKENLQNATNAQFDASIKGATGVANYNDELKQQRASGAITEEQYNAKVVAGYNKNNEFVKNAINGDFSGLSAYAQAAGLDISAGTEEQIDAVIDHMQKNNVILAEHRYAYYYESTANSILETEFSSKDAVAEVEEIYKLFKDGKITAEDQTKLLSTLESRVEELFGKVEDIEADYGAHEWTISYTQGEYGNESISFDPTDMDVVDGEGFVLGKEFPTTGTAMGAITSFALGSIDGVLVLRLGRKTTKGMVYTYFTDVEDGYVNTSDNAAFVAWAMLP